MNDATCLFDTAERCAQDARRMELIAHGRLSGVDYVELRDDELTLCVHFFGATPPALMADNFFITGGDRIRDLRILGVETHEHDDGDACLLVKLDRRGDFAPYCLCVVQRAEQSSTCSFDAPAQPSLAVPEGIDPRYACATFRFRLDCNPDSDCAAQPCVAPPELPAPAIDYLARDYQGFRRLLLDRLALTLPQWRERHVPDLGITLVELLAFTADQLSYELDAVATEAFLRTARRRISVRRHCRLVDYWLHEGLNARAWVALSTETDVSLPARELVFAALDNARLPTGLVGWQELRNEANAVFFEPLLAPGVEQVEIVAAHSAIAVYTWKRQSCCLPAGSTRATLVDGRDGRRTLRLQPCDLLVFEETRACDGGSAAGADTTHRHVVRLTRVTPVVDPLDGTQLLEIEWHAGDALPFDLLLSVRGPAPQCEELPAVIARGNVLLVDHGSSQDESDPRWTVESDGADECCICEGDNTIARETARRLTLELGRAPLTHADTSPAPCSSAASVMVRDARVAMPSASLQSSHPARGQRTWHAVRDLLGCAPDEPAFVVEIDDESRAHVRCGDGLAGLMPEAGASFSARYRVGNGTAGNVGREAITRLALRSAGLSGALLSVRNPLPARGGVEPESVEHAKRSAPHAYGRVLERAIAADDYARLAAQEPGVQGAFAELAWTGSWYEASVAIDRFDRHSGNSTDAILRRLGRARRIGHDLHLVQAHRVPLDIELRVCVDPRHLRGEVEALVRNRLSSRVLADGSRGLFHADNLEFGVPVAASRLVATVQAIAGVAHVEARCFGRLGAAASDLAQSLADNVIRLAPDEIAVLDADPNHPESGRLVLVMEGGR